MNEWLRACRHTIMHTWTPAKTHVHTGFVLSQVLGSSHTELNAAHFFPELLATLFELNQSWSVRECVCVWERETEGQTCALTLMVISVTFFFFMIKKISKDTRIILQIASPNHMTINSRRAQMQRHMMWWNREREWESERNNIITSACTALNFPPFFCLLWLPLLSLPGVWFGEIFFFPCFSTCAASSFLSPQPSCRLCQSSVALKCFVLSSLRQPFLPCAELWPGPDREGPKRRNAANYSGVCMCACVCSCTCAWLSNPQPRYI